MCPDGKVIIYVFLFQKMRGSEPHSWHLYLINPRIFYGMNVEPCFTARSAGRNLFKRVKVELNHFKRAIHQGWMDITAEVEVSRSAGRFEFVLGGLHTGNDLSRE
jgi:hypothetical protein